MITLLWKDYRNNAALLIIGAGIMLLPLVGAVAIVLSAPGETHSPEETRAFWGIALYSGSVVGLVLSQFTMLFLGGQIIAGERSTPTYQFLFYLPATRAKIVTSKLLFCAIVCLIIWLVYAIVGSATFHLIPPQPPMQFAVNPHFEIAAIGLVLFGCAWFASSTIESPTLAMGIGALIAASVAFTIHLVSSTWEFSNNEGAVSWTRIGTFALLGTIGIILGCAKFIRRVEP